MASDNVYKVRVLYNGTVAKISLKVVVHVVIIDQLNQTARKPKSTVIYSRAILVAETSESSVKMVICKIWTGTLANSAEPEQTPSGV